MTTRGNLARTAVATVTAALLTATAACGADGTGAASSTTSTPPAPAPGTPGGTASAPPASGTGKRGTVRIGGAGDILAHYSVWQNAAKNAGGSGYDFKPMFAAVKPKVSALDVAICHLETPLSKDNTNLSIPNTMVFNVPHEMAAALKDAGFDGCDRVGNHVLDRGTKGIASTRDVLTAAGLKQQGPTAEPSSEQKPVFYEAKGLKIAHLAYGYTTLNNASSNTTLPAGMDWFRHWQFPIVKAEGIIADAKKARAQGADLVVLSMHWGAEYSSQASAEQRELAKKLLGSPEVDLILGTHVHVAQPCEKINGKYVIYGMGNFISNQGPASASVLKPATQDGMIVSVEVTKGEDGKVTQKMTYQPTHVDLENHHVMLATPARNKEAYERVTWAVGQLGDQCDAKPAS